MTRRLQVQLPARLQAAYSPGQPLQPCFERVGVRFDDNRQAQPQI